VDKGDNLETGAWKESVRFRFEDWGWVVINIGMGIGAGIAMLPVEIGMKGLWVFMLAAVIGYPSMYLFQRVFVNSLVEAKSCKDYPGIISEYLGKNWGAGIGFLYFLMLIIWYFVYSETVIRDSASYLKTFGVTASNLSADPLYIIGVISVLTFIAAIGEKLLFKLSSVLALTVLTIILLMSFAMIPEWSTQNIAVAPGAVTLSKDAVVMLPFVLTSILFIQSLSPMVIFFRQNSNSHKAARFRSLRAMNLAFGILFVVVFFYANSFNLAISHPGAQGGDPRARSESPLPIRGRRTGQQAVIGLDDCRVPGAGCNREHPYGDQAALFYLDMQPDFRGCGMFCPGLSGLQAPTTPQIQGPAPLSHCLCGNPTLFIPILGYMSENPG